MQNIKVLRFTAIILALGFLLAVQHDISAQDESSDASDANVILKGKIRGRSGHKSSGTVTIVRLDNDRYQIQLEDDFFLDSAPEPYIGFGNPSYDPSSQVSPLLKLQGKQVYDLDEDFDPSAYSRFYLWCRPFNVPLGLARLRAVKK